MAKEPKAVKQIESIADLVPDARNANRGTERGTGLIETSLRNYGAGRSVLADRNGVLIAGNKTIEGAASAGLQKVRVVQTDGTEVVVVQRTDLDLQTDKAARELAIIDNRAGQVSLEWDADELDRLAGDYDIDLKSLGITEGELEDMRVSEVDSSTESRQLEGMKGQPTVKVVLAMPQLAIFEQAIEATGEINRADAVMKICEAYLGKKG